ncbi:MAG: anthranilate phosphoribosyltransferase [Saprospiraceae bacterium]
MKKILGRLFEHKKLTRQEAKEILVNISKNEYNESQIAAFMTVYLMRAISVDELQGFRDALLELCLPVDLEGRNTIDLCGTGGDGKNTFNISTLSSFIVAGAGYQVSKHGNYGVSSACGSSNVLEHLGYQFTNDVDVLKKQLDDCNICFFHAPLFHPAMKAVAPIRRQLGIKTFFNMLGPLVNPGKPKNQLVGVFNLELARLYHYLFQQTEKKFTIIHALDGYDEISLTGPFKVKTKETERLLLPKDIGRQQLTPESLFGGDTVASAADIFMKILNAEGTMSQNEVVLANSGMAIQCMRPDLSLADCMEEAKESLLGKKALQQLKRLVN